MAGSRAEAKGSHLDEAERADSKWPEAFETSKPTASDILPPESPRFLIPPKTAAKWEP